MVNTSLSHGAVTLQSMQAPPCGQPGNGTKIKIRMVQVTVSAGETVPKEGRAG